MAQRILIVDDNTANLYMLETLLRGYGFEVGSAENGKEALEKARSAPPDLIITDILMPVMDGYALCRAWKSDDALKGIPLVFYTATYTEAKDEAFAVSLGADRFILKPQEPDALMNILQEVLQEGYTTRPSPSRPLGEEMEFFRQYNEVLFKKLEKKMLDLEAANQEFRMLEERYRLSFENVSDVICTIGTDLIISNVSPSVQKLIGFKPEDFIGRSVSDVKKILTPESFERAMVNVHRILKGEAILSETYQLITKDNTAIHGEISGAPITRDGEIIGLIAVGRDITPRKLAVDALKASEKKYRDLFDFLPIPIFEMNLTADITAANRAIYQTFGIAEEDLKRGINALRLIAPENREQAAEDIERMLQGNEIANSEYTCVRLDGSTFPAIIISNVIRDPDNKPVGFRGAIIDIAQRKKTQEALQAAYEKREELEFIVNNSPAVVWLWKADPGWPVEYVSDSITRYGYTPDDFTSGRIPYSSIIHPDDLLRVGEEVERYTAEGKTEFTQEYRIFSKSGEIRWTDDRTWVRRGSDGSVSYYQGIAVDITDRKRTDEELRDAYRRLDEIIDFLPDPTFVINLEGKVVRWNRAIEKMTGIPKSAMIGKGNYEYAISFYGQRRPILIDLIMMSDKDFEKDHYEKAHREGDIMYAETYASHIYEGKGASLWVVASKLFDASGNAIGAIESIRNITRHKQAEEDLQKTLENFRKALATTIQVMVSVVEIRDPYTAGHQHRVANLAQAIATEMGLAPETIEGAGMAGSIHDIGKLSVPAEILVKPGRLTEMEFSLIKEHPRMGYEMLKDVELPWHVAEIIYQHHERMDGSGYPQGLKGNDILIEARIMAVADVVEAMASHRPYRPALEMRAALDEIATNRDILYDPEAVDACLRLFHEKGYQIGQL